MRHILQKDPMVGDRRVKSRFHIFPKVIGRELRWLERSRWVEEYKRGGCCDEKGFAWIPTQWWDE